MRRASPLITPALDGAGFPFATLGTGPSSGKKYMIMVGGMGFPYNVLEGEKKQGKRSQQSGEWFDFADICQMYVLWNKLKRNIRILSCVGNSENNFEIAKTLSTKTKQVTDNALAFVGLFEDIDCDKNGGGLKIGWIGDWFGNVF